MFVNLPGTMQSMIQRYIIKLERERRALQLDHD
jgi:c-di-GMP-binding flagellar brake protein YcgR